MMDFFDVAVVGGGPAGATTALCLAQLQWRVALLEATRFDGDRCGETLPPEINAPLRELGLRRAFASIEPIESPGIVSAWGAKDALEIDFLLNPCGPGWHVDRNRFDGMLYAQAGAAGAELFPGCAIRCCTRQEEAWHIGPVRARFLVNSSGRNGLNFGDSTELAIDDKLLAAVLRVSASPASKPGLRALIESTPFGWWYTAPVPAGEMVAMFFTGAANYARAPQEQLDLAPLTRDRLRGARILQHRVVTAPSFCAARIAGPGWMSVGDSAACYDPLSGRGVFKAMRHAQAAASSVDRYLRGHPEALSAYVASVHREFDAYARLRREHYQAEKRWSEHSFWRARHA